MLNFAEINEHATHPATLEKKISGFKLRLFPPTIKLRRSGRVQYFTAKHQINVIVGDGGKAITAMIYQFNLNEFDTYTNSDFKNPELLIKLSIDALIAFEQDEANFLNSHGYREFRNFILEEYYDATLTD